MQGDENTRSSATDWRTARQLRAIVSAYSRTCGFLSFVYELRVGFFLANLGYITTDAREFAKIASTVV